MSKKVVPENYPLPELLDVELSDKAKHYEQGEFNRMEFELIGMIMQFTDSHDSVEIAIDKVESFPIKDVSEGLDILVRLVGDPIE